MKTNQEIVEEFKKILDRIYFHEDGLEEDYIHWLEEALEEKDAQYKELLDEFPEIRDLIKLRKEKLIF